MLRDPDLSIFKWELGPDDEPPPLVAAAMRSRDRELEVERSHRFAEPYRREDGTRGNLADLIPELYQVNKQFELKLGSMTKRSLVRLELAHAIETKVLGLTDNMWIWSLPDRLRAARKSFCLGFRPSDGRQRVAWDNKAGLSRICPDDAREDSRRMQRRVIDPLLEMKKNGRQVTYCVFTLPNYQPGELRKGIKAIYKRFGALLKKRAGGKLKWDQVEAAMCVLEAPLARDRTWNVHLNVLLVHRGFLDYGELRKDWHWNVEFQRVTGGREELEKSLREIIKYSARAVAEKSQCQNTSTVSGISAARLAAHAGNSYSPTAASPTPPTAAPGQADLLGVPLPPRNEFSRAELGAAASSSAEPLPTATRQEGGQAASSSSSPGPPAMCDWTGEELLEWLTAFRGFRRTRTYRALYRLAKPAKDSLVGYLWLGKGEWVNSGWRIRLGPLDSIPGDKSTTPDALERFQKFLGTWRPPPRPPDKCERFA